MKSKIPRYAALLLTAAVACSSTKAFPAGVYVPAQSSPTDRIVEFTFSEDGTFLISYYDQKTAGGTYSVSGSQITLSESEGSPCFGYPATMNWSSTGSNLTFQFWEDTCPEGPSYDWVREWSKKP